MDYKNVIQQVVDFKNNLHTCFSQAELLTIEPYSSLLYELDLILENLNDPVISEPIDNLKLVPVTLSTIDQLGLGDLVALYIQSDMSQPNIVKSLKLLGYNVSSSDLEEWLNTNNNSAILSRGDIKGYGSVTDAYTQLQAVFENLKDLIIDTDSYEDDSVFRSAKTTRELVKKEINAEIRQTLKDGVALLKAISQSQKHEQFKRILIEEVNKESTEVAVRIWQRLKEIRDNSSLLEFNFS